MQRHLCIVVHMTARAAELVGGTTEMTWKDRAHFSRPDSRSTGPALVLTAVPRDWPTSCVRCRSDASRGDVRGTAAPCTRHWTYDLVHAAVRTSSDGHQTAFARR